MHKSLWTYWVDLFLRLNGIISLKSHGLLNLFLRDLKFLLCNIFLFFKNSVWMQVYFSLSFSLYVLPSCKPPQVIFNKNRKICFLVVSTWCYKMSCDLLSVLEHLNCCLDEHWGEWQGMIQSWKKSKLLKQVH